MGGLIASCALHYDFHENTLQEDRFQISRLEKDTLTLEDVEQCVIPHKVSSCPDG